MHGARLTAGLLAALLICGCRSSGAPTHAADGRGARTTPASTTSAASSDLGTDTRELTFPAADGLVVHATFHDPTPGRAGPVVVLAHQLCKSRGEWSQPAHDWVSALSRRGIATLAIDLRGHGDSTTWPDGTKHDLCAERNDAKAVPLYAGMVEDVAAAVRWARGPGKATAVALVGASIGANSVLVAFGDDPKLRAVVALSPGLDYFHIRTAGAVARAAGRAVVLVAAKDDPDSAASVATLHARSPTTRAIVFASGGHGNKIVAAHPALLGQLVAFVAAALHGQFHYHLGSHH